MKGYKIGFSEIDDGKDLRFALIKLDIPEGYPGLTIIPKTLPEPEDCYQAALTAGLLFRSYSNLPTRGLEYRSNVARVLGIHKIEMHHELAYNYYGGIGYAYTFSASDKIMDHAFSIYDNSFCYHPGEIIFPDKFDDTEYIRCTNGIHFFGSQNDAFNYIHSNWVWYRFNEYKDHMLVRRSKI